MRPIAAAISVLLLCSCSAEAQQRLYQPDGANPDGPELYAVFITSSTCQWSNREGFDQAVERAKLLLAEQASEKGMGFAIRGVALDWNPQDGIDYLLERFGQFDELAAGRNYFGADAAEYIWTAEDGVSATPQLVVFQRTISHESGQPEYTPNQFVARLLGTEIDEFVEAGGELPFE